MKNNIHSFLLIFLFLGLIQCAKRGFKWSTKKKNTLQNLTLKDSILAIDGISNDPTYGTTKNNPIKLGVTVLNKGATYPEKYFNALRGPQNKKISYRRIKSCCPFKTVNSPQFQFNHLAVLEVYELTYDGLRENVRVYVNFFDEPKKVLAPKGFKYVKF